MSKSTFGITAVLATALAAVAVLVGVLPDLRRYLRISRM
ncbi:DUF6893 family small protein [Streptomyces sp. NPDC002671]